MQASTAHIDREVRTLAEGDGRFVLAVSGGLDSMVLLDRAAALIDAQRIVVATFDHGTGEAARRAAGLVEREAHARGLSVRRGGGTPLPAYEASWRTARWAFLRRVASETGERPVAGERPFRPARIVTAHTADDQAETVLMRAMRGAGARGLAGLLAPSAVARPFVRVHRRALEEHARARSLPWIEDPSNASLLHHRNRIRHEILPALERARPGFAAWLLDLSERAAAWRREMDAVAERCCPSERHGRGGLSVAAPGLLGYDASSLAVLWASIAGRVGLALDRRGTHRLAAFTMTSVAGDSMPLSGGWQVARTDGRVLLSRVSLQPFGVSTLAEDGAGTWGRWRFVPVSAADATDHWSAELPAGASLTVRSWLPADRIVRGAGMVRVKRVLTEAGISAADRVDWPVVLADDAIVWIPGVSRRLAATARSGRPGVCIRCEPSDG